MVMCVLISTYGMIVDYVDRAAEAATWRRAVRTEEC